MNADGRRPVSIRRSWLFCAGADPAKQQSAIDANPDVLIPDLEDFTPPDLREKGRDLIAKLMPACRSAGIVAGVRINPLETVGLLDLPAVMAGNPDVVLLPKTEFPEQVKRLDNELSRIEKALGIELGTTEIVPNLETALGLVNAIPVAQSSRRVTACLLAAEDLATDLGSPRSREGLELAYARGRFLLECTAAKVLAIDAPYTFSDLSGVEAESIKSLQLGFSAKSAVSENHVAVVNEVFTPSEQEVSRCETLVTRFEEAQRQGQDRVLMDGILVEVPTYLSAKRLIARHNALASFPPLEP